MPARLLSYARTAVLCLLLAAIASCSGGSGDGTIKDCPKCQYGKKWPYATTRITCTGCSGTRKTAQGGACLECGGAGQKVIEPADCDNCDGKGFIRY